MTTSFDDRKGGIPGRMYRANYLVFPVSCMCSMPEKWQQQMCKLMDEFTEAFPDAADRGYRIHSVDDDGDVTDDQYGYRHDRFEPKEAVR